MSACVYVSVCVIGNQLFGQLSLNVGQENTKGDGAVRKTQTRHLQLGSVGASFMEKNKDKINESKRTN